MVFHTHIHMFVIYLFCNWIDWKMKRKLTVTSIKCFLYPTAENTPRLNCTTKIHKQGYPIRPIVHEIHSLSDLNSISWDSVTDGWKNLTFSILTLRLRGRGWLGSRKTGLTRHCLVQSPRTLSSYTLTYNVNKHQASNMWFLKDQS